MTFTLCSDRSARPGAQLLSGELLDDFLRGEVQRGLQRRPAAVVRRGGARDGESTAQGQRVGARAPVLGRRPGAGAAVPGVCLLRQCEGTQ